MQKLLQLDLGSSLLSIAIILGWLGLFFVGLFAFDSDLLGFEEPLIVFPEGWETPWEIVSWIIWIIFVIDVYFNNWHNICHF